jgi:hypothetical protein
VPLLPRDGPECPRLERGGRGDNILAAQLHICLEALWRGRTGPVDFGGELQFVGEDFSNGTLVDFVMESLIHSVDHPTGHPEYIHTARNEFYAVIAGNLSSPLETLNKGDPTFGTPLFWCQQHSPTTRALAAICQLINFDFDIPACHADDEFCNIDGIEYLAPGFAAASMKAYVAGALIPDEAYGVYQGCANDVGYMQCGTQTMLQLLNPSEYAPVFPLAGCNLDAFTEYKSYWTTACCGTMQILGIIRTIATFLIPMLFMGPAAVIADAILGALGIIKFALDLLVPGCDCTPVQDYRAVIAYRQNPQCVWDNYVMVLERLAPVPILESPCGLGQVAVANKLGSCACTSEEWASGGTTGGAFCESTIPTGNYGLVDPLTGDAYCPVGTGPGGYGLCDVRCGFYDPRVRLHVQVPPDALHTTRAPQRLVRHVCGPRACGRGV